MDTNIMEKSEVHVKSEKQEIDTMSKSSEVEKTCPADDEGSTGSTAEKKSGVLHGITALLLGFCNKTTAHGWGSVSRSPNRIVGCIWIIVTLTAIVITFVNISSLLTLYQSRPQEVKMVDTTGHADFPGVTVCNIYPISRSSYDEQLANEASSTYQWYQITKIFDALKPSFDALNMSVEFEKMQTRLKSPMGYFENVGGEFIFLSHQQKDFSLGCYIGDTPCRASTFRSANYYQCYTLKSQDDAMEVMTTGPTAGLSLILYLENDNANRSRQEPYLRWANTANAAGVRVVLHEQDARPTPEDMGFDIPPGYSASVGLIVNRHQKLGEPYNPCRMPGDRVFDIGFAYSYDSCLMSCQQVYIEQHCNCTSAHLPLLDKPSQIGALSYCGTWHGGEPSIPSKEVNSFLENLTCEATKMREFIKNQTAITHCNCIPTCYGSSYEETVTYTRWPNQESQESFFNNFVLDRPDTKAYRNLGNFSFSEITEKGLIEKNFVRLNVYLSSLNVKEFRDTASYDQTKLISDLGGMLGFWIGMSIISWVELLELVIRIFSFLIKSFTRK